MRISRYCLSFFFTLIGTGVLPAQSTDGWTIGDPAAAPGSPTTSYTLNGIDHINYYSGSVNTAIPVLTIGGRGSVARKIAIPIQRQWSAANGYPNTQQWAAVTGLYTSGCISVESVAGNSWACNINGQWKQAGPYVTYIVWTAFDGTQTRLKDTRSDGQSMGANVTNCTSLSSYTQYNRGKVFRSTDGSDLMFVADQDVIDQQVGSVISGTLIARDGAKLRFSADGYVSQVEDRNGNLITFSWQGTNSG